jgi:hypothetical protein
MSKKDNLLKGFNNLLQSTETKEEDSIAKENKEHKNLDVYTSISTDVQKYKRLNIPKYKELKKCTLYLPPEIMDSLAIMKVKTKKDLSVLAAEALHDYLHKNEYLNV